MITLPVTPIKQYSEHMDDVLARSTSFSGRGKLAESRPRLSYLPGLEALRGSALRLAYKAVAVFGSVER